MQGREEGRGLSPGACWHLRAGEKEDSVKDLRRGVRETGKGPASGVPEAGEDKRGREPGQMPLLGSRETTLGITSYLTHVFHLLGEAVS